MKIRPVGGELFHADGQTDGQTDSHDEANSRFLGAFARLRKATIGFVMTVCLSVRVEQLGSNWTDFHEIRYLRIFRKHVEKIQVLLTSDKNNCHFA